MITTNELDDWVRKHEIEAQGVIAELVGRLVAAAVPNPNDRRFPRADVINQPGEDGYLDCDIDFLPFVPKGKSFWEFGTGANARKKASDDYDIRTAAIDEETRKQASLILVTPNSGVHGWGQPEQHKWKTNRIARNEWSDIRIIDGPRLIEWLELFPSVERWLAAKMGLPAEGMESPSERWSDLSSIGNPPHDLIPDLFLVNRQAAVSKLDDIFNGTNKWLQVDTHFRSQVADVVAARIAELEDSPRAEMQGRCLIVTQADTWQVAVALRDPHILVADFDIDDGDTAGMRLLERAKKQGHAVIFTAVPGGDPHPNRVSIPDPNEQQITEALKKAGYAEGRAQVLGKRYSGNLNGLLRSMQRLAPIPEWAQGTDAANVAIAELIGGWNENMEGDREAIQHISGKEYGEWIGSIRVVSHKPGAPLKHKNGVWRFASRYEGWFALGSRIFDDQLDRFKVKAVEILSEYNPALELLPEQRYMAQVKGKTLDHSSVLRKGLAETLALLGSHSRPLTSASTGKAESTARAAIHEILKDADWRLWASLNDILPLLAEAAPEEFLAAVDSAISSEPCPFDTVFGQEGSSFGGQNYMTGVLWALETLAWDGDYLSRVFLLLGALAERDPGGKWGNRPANSLFTIVLPWFPQTAASVEKRIAAVKTLLTQWPKTGWQLLLNLLPEMHQTSMMTRKPAWRSLIPDDWSEGSKTKDYRHQIKTYIALAVDAAKGDVSRLNALLDKITPVSHSREALQDLISYLRSPATLSLPEEQRQSLWNAVTQLVSQHRRFSGAEWALTTEIVDQFVDIADRLSPNSAIYRNQRLFTDRDFDLYEDTENFEEEQRKLGERREKATAEVYAEGGVTRVLEFTEIVKSPVRVGIAFGALSSTEDDAVLLPQLLASDTGFRSQFIGGYIWGKFQREGWPWLDQLSVSTWTPSEIAEFLAYLPFTPATWNRATELLNEHELEYWSKARVNPFEAGDDIDIAIDRLLAASRVAAAVDCIARRIFQKKQINPELAFRALLLAAQSGDTLSRIDAFEIVQIIKRLQETEHVDETRVGELEWMYLPLLDNDYGTSPKVLEQKLAEDPEFFCHIIQTIFRSKKEDKRSQPTASEDEGRATNAYRLLHQWTRLPGTNRDGTLDGEALTQWFERVKDTCEESGHLDIALQRVGHVLRYYSPDPDGFFMHRAVAQLLDRKDAAEVRTGFAIEIYNSRGAYFVDPQGGPERELASQYRREAEELDLQGYTRVAATLRDVAKDYDREAEHNIAAAVRDNES